MVAPETLLLDRVVVGYQLIDRNTLRPVAHSGDYAETKADRFILLSARPRLQSFDRRVSKVLLTFEQSTSLDCDVNLFLSNAARLISSTRIPLRKYRSGSGIAYEADITAFVASHLTETAYFAIVTSSRVSFYVAGLHGPSGSVAAYSGEIGTYSRHYPDRLKSYRLGNYRLDVDLFASTPKHTFDLFSYSDRFTDFRLSLVSDFSHRGSSSPAPGFDTGLPKGFKLSAQQFLYPSAGRTYTYIDSDYLTHVFAPCENDDGTFTRFVDRCGGYLILEIKEDGYEIRSLDGKVMAFSGAGLLVSETVKVGSREVTTTYRYNDDGLLSSVSSGGLVLASISYGPSAVDISFPDTSSIALNRDENNLLTSVVDQEGVSYQLSYTSGTPATVSGVESAGRKLSLSFNGQWMVEEIGLWVFESGANSFERKETNKIAQGPYSASFADGQGLLWTYKFDKTGMLIGSRCAKSSAGAVLWASVRESEPSCEIQLSTDAPSFLKKVAFEGRDYPDFEREAALDGSSPTLSLLLTPEEKGRYFLYFEYSREAPSSYADLGGLTLSVSVGSYPVISNRALEFGALGEVGVFMEEIPISEERYGDDLTLSFGLSGEATARVRNVRLYRPGSKMITYYGLNSYAPGGALEGMEGYYKLSNPLQMEVDGLSYDLSVTHRDLGASMLACFLFGEGFLFCQDGKAAYAGVVAKDGLPLSSLKLVEIGYLNKRYSGSGTPFDGYEARVLSLEGDSLKEETIAHECAFGSTKSREQKYDRSLLPLKDGLSIPYGVDFNDDGATFGGVLMEKTYSRNPDGSLVREDISAAADGRPLPSLGKGGPELSYSADGRFLAGTSQGLFDSEGRKATVSESFSYGALGLPTQWLGGGGRTEAWLRDGLSRLVSYSAGDGSPLRGSQISYGNSHLAESACAIGGGSQIDYSYDHRGRVSQASLGGVSFSIERSGLSESTTCSQGGESFSLSLERSALGNPLSLCQNGREVLGYRYVSKITGLSSDGDSSADRLESVIDSKNPDDLKVRSYSYDSYGSICSVSENGVICESESCVASFIDGAYGRLAGSPANQRIVTYWRDGAIARKEAEYTYIGDPFVTAEETYLSNLPTWRVVTRRGRDLSSSGEPFEESSVWTAVNEKTSSLRSTFLYYVDGEGRPTPFVSSQLIRLSFLGSESSYSIDYSYNNDGALVGILAPHLGVEASYSYDSAGALVGESGSGLGTIEYSYDSRGNLLSATKAEGVSYSFTYDDQDRLLSLTTSLNGSTLQTRFCGGYSLGRPSFYKGQALTWDGNELTGYGDVSFSYDGHGRRVSKVSPSRSVSYLYVGDALIEETVMESDGSKDVIRYLRGPDGSLIGFALAQSVYLYAKDALGNVIAVYSNAGIECCRYLYDAYGNCEVVPCTPGGGAIGELNPIRYRSLYRDRETGLYYLGARYYDPEARRFVSMDGLLFLSPEKACGLNPYCYCLCDPVNYIDRTGHMAVAVALLILGGIGAVAGFVSQSISDAVTGKGFDWGRSGIAAAAGFLGGLCYAIPLVGGYVGAAVSSGINTIGQMVYSGKPYSIDDYAIAGFASAGIGILSSLAFGQLTSGISYFADASYFIIHFMEFAGDAGGIVLKNSVILQLSGQLLIRNTISTIANDAFNFATFLDRGTDYSLRYCHYRQSGMNPWEAFWYGMSY